MLGEFKTDQKYFAKYKSGNLESLKKYSQQFDSSVTKTNLHIVGEDLLWAFYKYVIQVISEKALCS